jgi:hypothetical protein
MVTESRVRGPAPDSDLRPFFRSLPLKGWAVDTFVASSWLVTGGPRPEASRGKARHNIILFHSLSFIVLIRAERARRRHDNIAGNRVPDMQPQVRRAPLGLGIQ